MVAIGSDLDSVCRLGYKRAQGRRTSARRRADGRGQEKGRRQQPSRP